MADLADLTAWCDGLLSQLDSSQRRQLTRQIAQELRRANVQRIAAQQTPEGAPFAPRKLRAKQGRIRRGMFAKLRAARFLKAESNTDSATVGFAGRVGRIARVHQEGLRDRVRPGGPEVRYIARPLIGINEADAEQVRATVLSYLALRD